MSSPKPIDLLIACKSCGIENLIDGYTPDLPAVCSQCRERLIELDLMESHQEIRCGDCKMALLLPKSTEVTAGESTCRCGSSNLFLQSAPTIPLLAETAGAFKDEDDRPEKEGFDWCRPASNEEISDDYNEVFDNDPGF
jgi:DNA-directed RNA polymerase subunit RPC12/RpoP